MYLHTKFVWESTWLGMWLVRGVVAVGVFERGVPEPSRLATWPVMGSVVLIAEWEAHSYRVVLLDSSPYRYR
jgi:hypothetical protein